MKYSLSLTRSLTLACLLGCCGVAAAQDITYDDVASRLFWRDLYSQGGWSLYCGFRFDNDGRTTSGGHVRIQPIYPMAKVLKQLGCSSRRQCRDTNADFVRIEADLHNLYPVWWEIAATIQESEYGEVNGEDWRLEKCDYERKAQVVEPRPIARGNIARALFYMHDRYQLQLDKTDLNLLKKWNLEDPPSKQEKTRNNIIESIQGNRNRFIDKPKLANLIGLPR